MKPTTKYYLVIFFGFSLFSGLAVWIIDLLLIGEIKILKLIFMSTFFGLILMLFAKTSIEEKLKEYRIKEVTRGNFKVRQKRSMYSGMNLHELIELIKSDPVFGKMKKLEKHNGLVLRSRVSFESWGEVIEILQLSAKDAEYEYLVTSRPRWIITIIDFMRNFIFVYRLENLMKPKETSSVMSTLL